MHTKKLLAVKLTLYLMATPFNNFANRVNLNRAAVVELPDHGLLGCLWKYDISDPTLVDLISNFFVLCTNTKVKLYHYS